MDKTPPKNNPSTKQGVFVDGPERAPRLCGIDKGFKVFGGVGGEKDAGETEDTQNQYFPPPIKPLIKELRGISLSETGTK